MAKEQSLGNPSIEDRRNSEWARKTGWVIFVKKGVRISKCVEYQVLQKGQVKIFLLDAKVH